MLLGEHGADQPHDRGAVGEDADHVGAPPDLLVEAFQRVVRPDLPPVLDREGRERQDLRSGVGEQRRGLGEALGELLHHAVVLGLHLGRRGLLVDRPHRRRHQLLGALRHAGEQVAHEVCPATLPGGAGEDRRYGLPEALVRVRGDKLDPGEAARHEAAQEAQPERPVLDGRRAANAKRAVLEGEPTHVASYRVLSTTDAVAGQATASAALKAPAAPSPPEPPAPSRCTLKVESSNENHGTVRSNGGSATITCNVNTTRTVTATNAPSFYVSKWSESSC